MRVVYIAGPFRAKNTWLCEQNIRRAEEAALAVAELGAAPLCPHANTRFFTGTLTEEFWLEATAELLRRCDAILLIDGWQNSQGACNELVIAKQRGLSVFYALSALALWLGSI